MKILSNYPMSKVTTLRIGGPAKEFVFVSSEKQLIEIIKSARKAGKQFLVIGAGSNLLVSDKGVDELVIKNEVSGIEGVEPNIVILGSEATPESDGNDSGQARMTTVTVKSGTPLQDLVNFTISHGFSGLQKLTGIPGTVGGAVYGNAAAYGQTISDYTVDVTCFGGENILTLTKDDCHFEYRDSAFKKNGLVILEIKFSLPAGNSEALKKESEEILEKRLAKYKPGILCPGSFFKNVLMEDLTPEKKKLIPPERDYYGKVPAWYFLDEVGAKSDQLGKIKIADYHGNLFMNLGGGTAKDFYNLAKKYYKLVKQKFGIKLEPEVQIINLPPFN